ncbi:hypothetical protein [Janthinobacterium lividum]|uniref:hypothetical protein n=1 Tax=Janthinobacterium lividum TaxID=29581 RepID=UPI00158815AA|nr:hypothetical protein [Janthinobacterium lividum]
MHRDNPRPAGNITHAYSLEASTKDIAALSAAAPRILTGSTIAIPYLAREDDEARLAAARADNASATEPRHRAPSGYWQRRWSAVVMASTGCARAACFNKEKPAAATAASRASASVEKERAVRNKIMPSNQLGNTGKCKAVSCQLA